MKLDGVIINVQGNVVAYRSSVMMAMADDAAGTEETDADETKTLLIR